MEVVVATFRRTPESRQVHSLLRGPAARPGPFLVHPSTLTAPLRGHMHTTRSHLNSEAATVTSWPLGP